MNTSEELPTGDSSATGLLWGMLSAVGYMFANLGLRGVAGANGSVADVDWAIWVSANKAAPVVLTAWTFVGWRALRGLPALPPKRMVLPLILTGLFMQWGGNVSFQYSLSRAGLALTVPFAFSTILISAAIVGRLAIGDPLTRATLFAIGMMIAAMTVLTRGTRAATQSLVSESDLASAGLAVAAACLSGIAYGAGGVMIRRCVRGEISHSATIVVLSTTGMLTLGGTSLLRIGPQVLLSTPPDVWLKMLGAGMATAVAFFAISGAYQHLSTVKVNLLNASQIAMSALAGVLLFNEPNTPWLRAGTALTIVGLILSARRDASTAVCPDAADR
ncbi:MAG: DMT family transporter [Planctomycetaceae bacterium]